MSIGDWRLETEIKGVGRLRAVGVRGSQDRMRNDEDREYDRDEDIELTATCIRKPCPDLVDAIPRNDSKGGSYGSTARLLQN